jgi:hypothetical protein
VVVAWLVPWNKSELLSDCLTMDLAVIEVHWLSRHLTVQNREHKLVFLIKCLTDSWKRDLWRRCKCFTRNNRFEYVARHNNRVATIRVHSFSIDNLVVLHTLAILNLRKVRNQYQTAARDSWHVFWHPSRQTRRYCGFQLRRIGLNSQRWCSRMCHFLYCVIVC